jgi:hypothetical protein
MTNPSTEHQEEADSKPGYFAVIPANVRYCKELPPCARLLYGEITALANKYGYCFAKNEYFAELYEVDVRTITNWLEALTRLGFIFVDSKKVGFLWKRKIWISKESQEMFTKGKNFPFEGKKMSIREEKNIHSAHNIYNSTLEKETTTTQQSSCSFSDSEKIKSMETLNLGNPTMQRALKFSLEEIKIAIECCLNPSKDIDNIDGYFMSALTEKWQPKPSKVKKEALKEETEKQQQQNRQKLYMEAKQIEVAYHMKFNDNFKFSVTETTITLKIGNGYSPYPLDNDAMKMLRQYIREKLNESL